ncbi:hypothetical protein [Methanococcoides burtonii]|nr:hypothetical protein [Methanococcoides burtonii]
MSTIIVLISMITRAQEELMEITIEISPHVVISPHPEDGDGLHSKYLL